MQHIEWDNLNYIAKAVDLSSGVEPSHKDI